MREKKGNLVCPEGHYVYMAQHILLGGNKPEMSLTNSERKYLCVNCDYKNSPPGTGLYLARDLMLAEKYLENIRKKEKRKMNNFEFFPGLDNSQIVPER